MFMPRGRYRPPPAVFLFLEERGDMEIYRKSTCEYDLVGVTERGANAENQDRIKFADNGNGFVLVDGAGGMEDGGAYAEITATVAAKNLTCDETSWDSTTKTMYKANDAARNLGDLVLHSKGGASACICSMEKNGNVNMSVAGDIKVFFVDENFETLQLNDIQATEDGYLINFVGSKHFLSTFPITISHENLRSATIVAASDGVWRHITPRIMGDIIRGEPCLDDAACRLIKEARGCLSIDDASVVLCRPSH